MKAFRTFDEQRMQLRRARICLRPNGPGSDDNWMEIGINETEFYGRIPKALCTNALLRHFPENGAEFTTLEMLCCDDEYKKWCAPALMAIAKAYWTYSMAHKELTAVESAFYLLFATATLTENGETLDFKAFDYGDTFAGYCLERVMEK